MNRETGWKQQLSALHSASTFDPPWPQSTLYSFTSVHSLLATAQSLSFFGSSMHCDSFFEEAQNKQPSRVHSSGLTDKCCSGVNFLHGVLQPCSNEGHCNVSSIPSTRKHQGSGLFIPHSFQQQPEFTQSISFPL